METVLSSSPSVEVDSLKEYAVLWHPVSTNDHGEVEVVRPIEIKCRWEFGTRLVDSQLANIHGIRARVHVAQPVAVESIIWRGRLDSLPRVFTNLMQVVFYEEVPDLKCRHAQRSLLVGAWHGKLPGGLATYRSWQVAQAQHILTGTGGTEGEESEEDGFILPKSGPLGPTDGFILPPSGPLGPTGDFVPPKSGPLGP